MTEIEMETFFEMMGAHLRRPDRNGNRSAKCPLAPWTHTKGFDKSPSLTAKAGEKPVYRCWACHSQGTLFNLAREYSEKSGDHRPLEYVSGLTKSHFWGRSIEYDAKYKRVGKQIQTKIDKELTEDKLAKFMKLVPQYAFDRGISRDQILRWEIGLDQREDRMIFTVRDYLKKLIGVSGRDITGQKKPKYKHYFGFKKEAVLYGEPFIDRLKPRAYIVEGFLDVLALERLGVKNVLASMGTSLSDDQLKKLDRWFKEVVFIPDVDDKGAGLQFVQVYGEKLAMMGKKVGVAGVRPSEDYENRKKPRDWEPCDYRFVPIDLLKDKDPADLSKDDLEKVLQNIEWIRLEVAKDVAVEDAWWA